MFILFFLFACQVFYYEDETVKELELAKVTQSYNTGINRAIDSSVRIDVYDTAGQRVGHGSGNLFRIGSKQFVITASHVLQDTDSVVLREKNGNMVPGLAIWADLDSDVAIILPLNSMEYTDPSSYVNNKKSTLDGKNLYFHGYPSDHDGLLIQGFVCSTGYSSLIMQSNAWFGASGSVVFDQSGRAVGVVHAITMEINPFTGLPAFIETVVVVNRVYNLNRKDILRILGDEKIKNRNTD